MHKYVGLKFDQGNMSFKRLGVLAEFLNFKGFSNVRTNVL